MLLTSLGLIGTAHAGTTLGVGVGGLFDVPDVGFKNCGRGDDSGGFVPHKVDGVDAVAMEPGPCKAAARFGGQLIVPLRIGLSPLATLRLTPGVIGAVYNGSISWDEKATPTDENTKYQYSGHTALLLRPQLAIGGEFAFSQNGVTPYIGAGVTVGANFDVQSLGPNANGKHIETVGAYQLRDANHCNQQIANTTSTDACNWDATHTGFGLGAEVQFGVRSAGTDKPGFFAEASYNLLSLAGGRTPKNYSGGNVKLGPAKINTIGITAGVLFPL